MSLNHSEPETDPFKRLIETENSEKVTVIIASKKNSKQVILINSYPFSVLNPEIVVCHMEPSVKLTIELSIDKGRGYVPADENKTLNSSLGRIAIDSIHTPIKMLPII